MNKTRRNGRHRYGTDMNTSFRTSNNQRNLKQGMIEAHGKVDAFGIKCTVGTRGITALLCFMALATTGYAQYENVWVYGNGCGMDFNQANPDPVIIPTNMESYGEGNASVCDDQGQLLFYTNGYKVWDGHGNIMPNGDGLINDPFFPPLPAPGFEDYTSSSSQGALIVPWPEQPGKYYIFSMTSIETGVSRLYYSIVDMQLNGGMGDVVPASKGIFMGNDFTEHMTGVVGDRCNTWLLVIPRLPNELHAYSISADGIDPNPVVSPLLPVNYHNKIGAIDAAPNRRQLAIGRTGFGLYDFDPATGIATGKVALIGDLPSFSVAYSACFSPDNSKLYVSYVPILGQTGVSYQFDLSSGDSLTIVNSLFELSPAVTRYKRAPNGRIYTTQDMVIMQPDLAGAACQLEPALLAGACAPGGSRGFPGFANVVPVPVYDTFLNSREQSAACFASRTIVSALDDSTGWDYLWNTGITGKEIVADTPGVYWITYHTPPCVYHADTFHVSFPNGVLPTIYTSAECRNDSNGYAYAYTYPGDPVRYAYTWIRGSDTLSTTDTLASAPSGDYSLHIQTNTGCDTLLFLTIPEENFQVSFSLSDTLICSGDTIQLINTSDTHFNNFHWSFGNGDTFSSRDPTPYIYPESGAYRLILAGEGQICRDTAYQTVLVDEPVSPEFELQPKNVCVGQPVYFFPKSDSTTVRLVWDIEDQLRSENRIQNRYQHAFTSSDTFPVTLTVQSRACPDTGVTHSIRVHPYPEVDLGPDSSICLNGQPIYLKNLRTAPVTSYQQVWNTGDTTASLKVVHPGTYTLRVTTGPIGCTTTESIEITKDCYIDVPNAFTPDGDGYNDYFLPRQLLTENISRFRMQVFNRWGQTIFETTHLNGRGWDGRFNGKTQPVGVYLYRIETDFTNGRQETYEGNVTLLR